MQAASARLIGSKSRVTRHCTHTHTHSLLDYWPVAQLTLTRRTGKERTTVKKGFMPLESHGKGQRASNHGGCHRETQQFSVTSATSVAETVTEKGQSIDPSIEIGPSVSQVLCLCHRTQHTAEKEISGRCTGSQRQFILARITAQSADARGERERKRQSSH